MGKCDNLRTAKENKTDEFYTQLGDIENELKHYKNHFKNKVVFCNCDDPYESNFFKYFAINFNYFGLKKLICTCYDGSPITGEQLSLFDFFDDFNIKEPERTAYKIVINEVDDFNNDGAVDLLDVEYLLKNKKNVLTKLKGNGDFRSEECIELLKEADIVVTNPPFSLFREYVNQLETHGKKYLIIGNKNAISYKEFFQLLMENKVWLGFNPVKTFMKSDGSTQTFGNIGWFTNLDITKRHESITLYKEFNEEYYQKYDNYDAINVEKVSDIPCDYYDLMGVPITFLEKYNPEQFVIVGNCDADSPLRLKTYSDWIGYYPNGEKTGRTGSTFGCCPVLVKNDHKTLYYEKDGVQIQTTYWRIFIKRKFKNDGSIND